VNKSKQKHVTKCTVGAMSDTFNQSEYYPTVIDLEDSKINSPIQNADETDNSTQDLSDSSNKENSCFCSSINAEIDTAGDNKNEQPKHNILLSEANKHNYSEDKEYSTLENSLGSSHQTMDSSCNGITNTQRIKSLLKPIYLIDETDKGEKNAGYLLPVFKVTHIHTQSHTHTHIL